MRKKDVLTSSSQVAAEEGAYAADIAEQLVPGGAGLVQGLVRAEREVLRGLTALLDANAGKLAEIEESIADPERPRWTGSIGRGLLFLAVRKVARVHATISRVESAVLNGIAANILRGAAQDDAAPPPPGKSERVKIE